MQWKNELSPCYHRSLSALERKKTLNVAVGKKSLFSNVFDKFSLIDLNLNKLTTPKITRDLVARPFEFSKLKIIQVIIMKGK